MITKSCAFILGLVGSSLAMAQACNLGLGTASPASYKLGPNAQSAYNSNYNVQASLNTAKLAWNGTDAAHYFLYYGTSSTDCADSSNSYQIGILSFQNAGCTNNSHLAGRGVVAVMHWGLKSVELNQDVVWHAGNSPAPGEGHLASVLVHEFGHLLGLAHMENGQCNDNYAPCSSNPGIESMNALIEDGHTCAATIEQNDESSANALYP